MTARFAFGLTIGNSLIHGKGCFAAIPFHQNQQIAEYIAPGEEITTDYLYELYFDQTRCRCRTATCDETTSLAAVAECSAEQASQTSDHHSGDIMLGVACEG